MSDSPPQDVHHRNTSSFQGIPDPSVVGLAPDTPPISSQPELAGSNILSITTSQLQALHTVGGSYQPTPVSDAPGLFERTADMHFNPLPSLPLSVALQLVAPYNPTPTSDPQHDNERSVEHDRDATDEGPSPFEGTAPDGTPLERRDIYAALLNHLPFPARLPLEGSSIEDHYVPDKEDALEHTKITDELLAKILEDRLGYSGYILESDIRCRKDVNIQLDGLVISDYVHALVAALDCGMEPRNIREIPYRALSQLEWFRVANALLAAIARGIIRSKEFTRAKNLSTELIPDNLPRGPGVDMPLTTGALLQALAEQIAGEVDIRNDRSTGEQIVAYFDWAKESAMKGAAKLAEHEAKSAHAPSAAQIAFWKKEAETELKEGYRDDFLRSPEGLEAMEQFVRSIQSHDVTREARRNVVRMIENSLLSNKGEMIGIEREAKANLIARFSAESNAQEDEWRAAYFARLMERLKGGQTDARLVPGETASQFVRDVAGAINAEVESRVDRMVKTVEQTAREAYQSEMDRIVAKATTKGAADAKAKADEAYQITMERDSKVNLVRTDIALQIVRTEYEQQLIVLQKQAKAELDIELHSNITSFRARVKGDIGPLDNVLLEEITQWVETRGYQLTEIDREVPPTKRADMTPGEGGKKRRRAGEQQSRSSSIASFTAPLSPAAPVTPPMCAPAVQALMVDNNRTPTPIRTRNLELMDIEKSSVQQLQSGMEDLHKRKEAANQTVAASLHAPANQMAVSPTLVLATLTAESVISTRPLPARTTPPIDPTLAAILSALDRIQSSVDSLDKRVQAVEKPAPRTKPSPAAAAAVSMPNKPAQSRPSNPVIDLKAKVTTPRPPKPKTLVPASPPRRIDDIDAFESYRGDNYDADFPSTSAPWPAPSQGAQTKAAEWIEVKLQPNHRRGIINLDYATAARSEQVRNTAAQVTQAQNRTPQGGLQRRPADRPAANETIITIVRNGGSESKSEEEAIRSFSPAFIILAARTKIEQLTKHAIVLVGGWWVSKLDKKGHKKRNGNFNFTAAGNVSHEQVIQFQHVFLEHLKVGAIVTAGNWVWAQLRHVRTTDHQQNVTGPDTLIKEMRRNVVLANVPIPQMPHYACAPHNLGEYATVVFAYMDHTGKIAKEAGEKGIWMFGKRCQFVRLGDSPVFTQCGKCHELGHVTNMCPLPRNAARCYTCGGAHESGSHDFLCKANTHKVGGKCNCAYPCLLCKQTGHTCRDCKCSKRGAFPAPPLASAKKSTTPPQKQAAQPATPLPQDTPADDNTPPPLPPSKNKGKGKAPAESFVSTQREAPTMDDIPVRVKPSRAQLNRDRAKKRAEYQRGRATGLVDPVPMRSTIPSLPSNRFELLPDEADDAEAQVPVPLEEGEPELPPLSQPKSNALTQQDFQLRERAMFVDIASLPSEAMIQLAITRKYTDHNLAANAMRAADKAWGGNGDLERILGYQARYAHVHQWPLTAEDTLTAIQAEANEGFRTEDEVAASYQRTTAAGVTPLDFFFARTERLGADNVFFTSFPPVSSPAELDTHLARLDNRVAKAYLRHLDMTMGGSGLGGAIQTKWSAAELEHTPALATTLENWRLSTEAQDAEDKRQELITHWARLMHSESIRLVNSGVRKSPALPFPICQKVIVPDYVKKGTLTTEEECKDLAYRHTPYERITWNSDILPIPRPRVSFLQRAQRAARANTPTPHALHNV
jgi:hypothetical protein